MLNVKKELEKKLEVMRKSGDVGKELKIAEEISAIRDINNKIRAMLDENDKQY